MAMTTFMTDDLQKVAFEVDPNVIHPNICIRISAGASESDQGRLYDQLSLHMSREQVQRLIDTAQAGLDGKELHDYTEGAPF